MKRSLLLLTVAALMLCGCRTHILTTPSGMVYKGRMFFTGATFVKIHTPDGLEIEGYKANSEVEAMSSIAEAAARGAAAGALP